VTFTDAVNLGRIGRGYAQAVGRKSDPTASIFSLRTKKWTCNSTDLHLRHVFRIYNLSTYVYYTVNVDSVFWSRCKNFCLFGPLPHIHSRCGGLLLHLITLSWTSIRPVAEASTCTKHTIHKKQIWCPHCDSNPQVQQTTHNLDGAATGIGALVK